MRVVQLGDELEREIFTGDSELVVSVYVTVGVCGLRIEARGGRKMRKPKHERVGRGRGACAGVSEKGGEDACLHTRHMRKG